MYAKYIVLFCLFGLSALLSAQAADQVRINIRIFPSQVLSIATAKDSQNASQNNASKTNNSISKELMVSNLYGYQIKLLNENHPAASQTEQKTDDKCKSESKLIYSNTSSGVNQKIPTAQFISDHSKNLNKCVTSDTKKMMVYLIITQ